MSNPAFGRRWSAAEDAHIRANYQALQLVELARPLDRTRASVAKRAAVLGLKKRPVWTAEEDRKLRFLWGEDSTESVAMQLGRSTLSTYWRAAKLGLPLGCPPDMEYLLRAAERTGFSYDSLERIIEWARGAGVFGKKWRKIVRRSMSRGLDTRTGTYRRIVDPLDVDAAVAAWMKTETIEVAAERLGMSSERVRAIMIRFAVDAPPRPRPAVAGRPWRIPSDVIDAAVAEWRRRESLQDAAKRTRVRQDTLAARLKAANASGIHGGRPWYLVPAEVDAIVGRAAA